jgi:pimeloyl-ACP methyl ester carboxylesterase
MPHGRLAVIPGLVLPVLLAGCAGTPPTAAPSSAPASAAASTGTDLVADIDVGGRTLHLVCLGPVDTGAPIVVLEAGGGAPYSAWSEILTRMQASHRICAYDRAGLGASPPAPEASRTTEDIVTDLHALLTTADVAGPYVLVGHSFGAWPLALYASEHPDDVAGLVFVDPRGPKVSAEWLAALPAPAASEDPAVAANRDELTTFENDPSINDEHLHLADSAAEVTAVLDGDGPLFGDRPVVVLGAADTNESWADLPADLALVFDQIWLDGQKALAEESTAGTFVAVRDSGHSIQFDQPTAVIDAIEGVLADLGR